MVPTASILSAVSGRGGANGACLFTDSAWANYSTCFSSPAADVRQIPAAAGISPNACFNFASRLCSGLVQAIGELKMPYGLDEFIFAQCRIGPERGRSHRAIGACLFFCLETRPQNQGHAENARSLGDEIGAALDDDTAEPLCIHCLTPHGVNDNFCEHCGATVGDLINYLPPTCFLSYGYVLRIGTDEDFKRTPGSVAFFFLAAFMGGPFILIPFYWVRVLSNLNRPTDPGPPDPDAQD